MISRIFIDANIPLYGGGRDHPLREPSLRVLRLAGRRPDVFVTSAEVLQEILHRYLALRYWQVGRQVFEGFAQLMDGRVEPVIANDVEQAATLVGTYRVQARDLLHIAVMRRLGVTRVASADRGFDTVPDIERLDPADVDAWASTVAP